MNKKTKITLSIALLSSVFGALISIKKATIMTPTPSEHIVNHLKKPSSKIPSSQLKSKAEKPIVKKEENYETIMWAKNAIDITKNKLYSQEKQIKKYEWANAQKAAKIIPEYDKSFTQILTQDLRRAVAKAKELDWRIKYIQATAKKNANIKAIKKEITELSKKFPGYRVSDIRAIAIRF